MLHKRRPLHTTKLNPREQLLDDRKKRHLYAGGYICTLFHFITRVLCGFLTVTLNRIRDRTDNCLKPTAQPCRPRGQLWLDNPPSTHTHSHTHTHTHTLSQFALQAATPPPGRHFGSELGMGGGQGGDSSRGTPLTPLKRKVMLQPAPLISARSIGSERMRAPCHFLVIVPTF